ncbi:MAG: alpha/beta fold hydrolase [Brachymonas sp.]|nr:alpha/beta fold hydrolase [Brachymonas sp.]
MQTHLFNSFLQFTTKPNGRAFALTLASAFKRAGALACTLAMVGCSTTAMRIGAESPVTGLGKPEMINTALGKLAVWDSAAQGAPLTTAAASAPPVVLWPSIFTDHVIYSSLVAHWQGKRRLILIDGPGHGASEGPKDKTFTMQACAVAMQEILRSKSIAKAVVGGTSWGGLVAGEFAVMYPQMTQGVLLLNTPFFITEGGASMGEKMITWGSANVLGTDLFTNGVARAFFLPATREAGGLIMTHFHQNLDQSDSKALSTAIRSVLIEREPLADKLAQIQAPALIVAGLQDGMYPIEKQREAVKRIKFGKLEELDTQHISVVDKPKDVAKLLDAFLDGLVMKAQ